MSPGHPALIVGMTAEARIAHTAGWPVGISGGDPDATARAMLAAGATGLVSLGFAGGLAPDLPAGTAIVPTLVIAGDRHYPTDPALAARLGGPDGRSILGERAIVATAAAKQRLWRDTGAAAVDMESGSIARVAAEYGVAFAALRIICDPVERDLPPAALAALDSRGRIGLGRVLGSLLRHPGQLRALLLLAADARLARRALLARVRGIR